MGTADQLTRAYAFTRDIMLQSVGNISAISDISSGSTWHMRTETGSFVIDSDKITEDIRFTDAIDLTPEIRLGYIDKNDIAKLSIGNFATNQSVLVRLDRTTGDSIIVRKGIDIQALLLYRGLPAYMDSAGGVYSITY